MFNEKLYVPLKDKDGNIVPGKFVLKNPNSFKKFKFKINWTPCGSKNYEGMYVHVDLGISQSARTSLWNKLTRKVPGVVEAAVFPYMVYVEKADNFVWDQQNVNSHMPFSDGVVYEVLEAIKDVLNCDIYEEMPHSRTIIDKDTQHKHNLSDLKTDCKTRNYEEEASKPEKGALAKGNLPRPTNVCEDSSCGIIVQTPFPTATPMPTPICPDCDNPFPVPTPQPTVSYPPPPEPTNYPSVTPYPTSTPLPSDNFIWTTQPTSQFLSSEVVFNFAYQTYRISASASWLRSDDGTNWEDITDEQILAFSSMSIDGRLQAGGSLIIQNPGTYVPERKYKVRIRFSNSEEIFSNIVEIFDYPAPTPTTTTQPISNLFNKSSWSSIPGPFKSYLDSAADRWSEYIKYNPTTKTLIQSEFFGWDGLELASYQEENNPSSPTIASCGPYHYIDLQSGPGVQFNSISFAITINKYYQNLYNSQDWINILTHELGHALGIGIYWNPFFDSSGGVSPVNYFLNGSAYVQTQSAYNSITNLTRNKVPLESSGSSGTASAHWEDNYRNASTIGAGGLNYPGISGELMNGYYSQGSNLLISNLSIKSLVDLGYQEVNPGSNEGNPIVVSSSLMAPINRGIKLNCNPIEHINNMRRVAKINLETKQVTNKINFK